MADIYADEGITGTKATVRQGFQRMIRDCMDGQIDIILTKSVSRFSSEGVSPLFSRGLFPCLPNRKE